MYFQHPLGTALSECFLSYRKQVIRTSGSFSRIHDGQDPREQFHLVDPNAIDEENKGIG